MEERPQSRGLVPVETDIRPPAIHDHHPHFGAGAPLEEVDIRGALRVLWRRKFLLVGTVVLITGLAWLQVSKITPTYNALAFVVLGPQAFVKVAHLFADRKPLAGGYQDHVAVVGDSAV